MGIAINILSAVLKSVVNNKIGNELANELIGISIDGISEKGINMISDYIDKEKAKMDHILSKKKIEFMNIPEENIDFVVAEIKDLLSKIILTDEVFRQCKYDYMKLSVYLWDEYCLYKDGYTECESDIKKVLLTVADALIRLMRESEEFEKYFLIQISNSIDDTKVEIQKISDFMQKNFNKLDANNQEILVIMHNIFSKIQNSNIQNGKQQKVKSRTQEYADKWNNNMFLNDFDEWDENAGVNIKLSDVYIEDHLPHFIWGNNEEESNNLNKFLFRYITKSNENKMLLILGQPGIGKSTLITWITAKFNEYAGNILVYQFASDLKNVNWKSSNISNEILDALNLSNDDLHGKILILDGFDEVSVGGDRKGILDQLYGELIYRTVINHFKLIITCRENYVQKFLRMKCDFITLRPWDEMQIESFCTLFLEKTKGIISKHTMTRVIENKDIFGIPLILYMILALNITIEKEGSIVDIYDKIFSLEGGIYDRCIENKNFADNHRIVSEIKKQIHQISREIAIWMFENNPNEAFIPQREYERICDNVIKVQRIENKDIQQDFLIGNFFKLRHCEGVGTEELYFVHRSIYEYFVAESIYSSIEKTLQELSEESKEKLARNIAVYLKRGLISNTIGEYLKFKILKFYNRLDTGKQERFYKWWEETVDMMISHGMFYFTGNSIMEYENIIYKETCCFVNLLKILRMLFIVSKQKYIFENMKNNQLDRYISYRLVDCRKESPYGIEKLNLSKVDLTNVFLAEEDLRTTNLKGVSLFGANLRGANLSGIDLYGVNLRKANLEEANLRETNLKETDLREANLGKADLREADLREARLKRADLQGIIFSENQIDYLKDNYISEEAMIELKNTKKLLSYKEFRRRNIVYYPLYSKPPQKYPIQRE